VLHALVSNTTIIKEVLVKGALIYLLHLFCNSTAPNIREETALLFSKVSTEMWRQGEISGDKRRHVTILSK